MRLITRMANFEDVDNPGTMGEGINGLLLKSIEISNPSDDDAVVRIIRKDEDDMEYMVWQGVVEAGNYASFFNQLTMALPAGHKLVCETDNEEILVVGNMMLL